MAELVTALCSPSVREKICFQQLTYPLDGSRERQRLMKLICTTFVPYDIARIVIAMLRNRSCFVIAASAQMASTCVIALLLLIEPFQWDNPVIPVVPVQSLDLIHGRGTFLAGLTRPELVNQDRLSPHIFVNYDTKLVMENPGSEMGSQAVLKIQAEEVKFARMLKAQLKAWKRCPGFPHEIIALQIQRFIVKYLQMITGPCESALDFVRKISGLPEVVIRPMGELVRVDIHKEERFEKLKVAFQEIFKCQEMVNLDMDGLQLPEPGAATK
jgi:hypothetical protein